MQDSYIDIFKSIDKAQLMSKREVLEFFRKNGEHEPSLALISERYEAQFAIDPIWRYPLSDGWHSGAFIIPIQEGYLWLPYDEVDSEYFEILLPDAATMLDTECCERFINELKEYADSLCRVLQAIQEIQNEEGGS